MLQTRAKELLYDAQEELEKEQREEEDKQMNDYLEKRDEEQQNLKNEFNQEWEVKLKALTEKFETHKGRKKEDVSMALCKRYQIKSEYL